MVKRVPPDMVALHPNWAKVTPLTNIVFFLVYLEKIDFWGEDTQFGGNNGMWCVWWVKRSVLMVPNFRPICSLTAAIFFAAVAAFCCWVFACWLLCYCLLVSVCVVMMLSLLLVVLLLIFVVFGCYLLPCFNPPLPLSHCTHTHTHTQTQTLSRVCVV